jgi:gliding motility-associated-like protein
MTLSYFTNALGTGYLYNPATVTTSGTYYIQGINKDGCMNILPVQVIIDTPDIIVTDPAPVVFPTTVDLSKTYTPQPGYSYGYYTNSEATIPVESYNAIKYGGKFYIKAVNSTGCIKIVPVNVVVNPPLPYNIIAPNTFTPNNDGINDHFMISINGVLSFKSVKIYNRNGQLVFTTKSPNDYWDGNFNGQSLPVGTYYWLFEGTDDYYHTKVDRAGPITLLR